MKKIYVVDASGYLYSSYYAIRNMTNSRGESTNALFGFVRAVQKLIKDFSPEYLVAVFDGPRNGQSREALYSEYKAHRKESPQDLPSQIDWAREYCAYAGVPIFNIPEVEADDVMGTIAVWAEKNGMQTYLCTSDKDLCQMVNENIFLLNTRKDNLIIDSKEVENIHGVPPSKIIDLFALIGDSSDNIPGVRGIGPKTAIQLLQQFGSLDALLAHPEQIEGEKKRASITENKEMAELSRLLVTIDTCVPIPEEVSAYLLRKPDMEHLKSFFAQMNFNSLLRELDSLVTVEEKKFQEVPVQYHLVDTEEALQELIHNLRQHKQICIDTIPSTSQPIKAELIGIGFGVEPHEAWYVPTNGQLGLHKVIEAIKPLLEDKNTGFYGHNIKFDYHILANYDVIIANICFDVMVASYLLNSHLRQHSLENLSLESFGFVKTSLTDFLGKGKNAVTMPEIPLEKMCRYCCEDVDMTCQLKLKLEKLLQERNLTQLFTNLELPLLKVLAHMERYGIYVDAPFLQNLSQSIALDIDKAAKQIYAFAGEEFNLNSPKQLSDIMQNKLQIPLPKKTATGYSTNAEILEDLKWQYPIAQAILNYRTLEKLRSTYIDSLPTELFSKTQRIHCTFNQSVAATGRLSCQEPNLQNIPIRTEEGRKIREAFRPQRIDWSFLSADYSQMELRLLGHLSDDPVLISSFETQEDIHASTAAAIFNIPMHAVTPNQRNQAKAVNFGIIYGQSAFGLSKELGISVKEASAYIDRYFNRYVKVYEYLEASKADARKTGKTVTFTGRERLIPEINSKNPHLRSLAERLALNTPIQGAGADIIKMAMLAIDAKAAQQKLSGFMILQIHDELVFEVPDAEMEQWKSLVREAMENVFQLKVPLIVNIAVGKNWKEC